MITVALLLVLAAFFATVAAAVYPSRVPIWIALLFVVLSQMIVVMPIR